MSCNVQILNENSGQQVVIPNKALVEQMGEFFVFVADSGKVKQTKIETGGKVGNKIVVYNVLKAGDKIVIDGMQKLHNGSMIVTEKPKTTLTTATN